MEPLASSSSVQDDKPIQAKMPNHHGLRTMAVSSLVVAGIAAGLLGLLADSVAACGHRSTCVRTVRVCRSACYPSYARPTYFPRSYHAYPTYYGVR